MIPLVVIVCLTAMVLAPAWFEHEERMERIRKGGDDD